MTNPNKSAYCCNRFDVAVEEGYILKAEDFDETEWYFPELGHLYFCPFCGTHIKDEGFGDFDKQKHK